jgi:hypothetical protein
LTDFKYIKALRSLCESNPTGEEGSLTTLLLLTINVASATEVDVISEGFQAGAPVVLVK